MIGIFNGFCCNMTTICTHYAPILHISLIPDQAHCQSIMKVHLWTHSNTGLTNYPSTTLIMIYILRWDMETLEEPMGRCCVRVGPIPPDHGKWDLTTDIDWGRMSSISGNILWWDLSEDTSDTEIWDGPDQEIGMFHWFLRFVCIGQWALSDSAWGIYMYNTSYFDPVFLSFFCFIHM